MRTITRPNASQRSENRRRTVGIVVAVVAIEAVAMRLRGYRVGADVVVRCRQGHLFSTIWLPAASLKSLRFGWWRYQYCPVGHHWSLVTPVRESDLSEEDIRLAHEHKDIRIP